LLLPGNMTRCWKRGEKRSLRLLEELQGAPGPVDLKNFCSKLVARFGEDIVYNCDFLSFIIEMNRDKKPGEQVREIHCAVDPGRGPDTELKTIEAVFAQAALAAHLEATITRLIVRSFPEEDLELLPGLKITNMQFSEVKEG
jgi:hypothetical protein